MAKGKKRVNFLDNFSKLDIYGQEITFTYKGSRKYRTALGAFFTLCCFVCILAYAAIGLR
jgi:hypothetical protein